MEQKSFQSSYFIVEPNYQNEIDCENYLQLAILSEHVCRSMGYSFKFIGQASVREILKYSSVSIMSSLLMVLCNLIACTMDMNKAMYYLMLYKTSPPGKTLTYALLTKIA